MTLALYNDGLDDTPQRDGDSGFMRFNNTASRQALAPGTLSRAVNCWMETDGLVKTRPGRSLVSNIAATSGGADIEGMLYFDTPTKEAVIIPAGADLWEIAGDSGPIAPTVVAGAVLPAVGWNVMAQLIDRVFIANTANIVWAYWNGAVWSTGTVTQFTDGSTMPAFRMMVTHRFRVFGCAEGTNKIYASKILQAHNSGPGGDWDALENVVVGTGTGDPTRALLSGQQNELIVLNEGSCWTVDTSALLAADWTITKLTDLVGCVAGNTAIMVGQDVYFLSRYGLVSLSGLVTRDSISAANTLSAPVNATIERINWEAVDGQQGARCMIWRNLLLLAVPLDANTTANRMLAYNTLTKEWVGEWEYSPVPNVAVWGHACVTRFSGKQETLWAYPGAGYITRLDEDYAADDSPFGAPAMIETWLSTRAIGFGQTEAMKMPFWLELEFYGSSTSDMAVVFVPDDELTFPDIALMDARVIDSGLSIPASQYTRRRSWHIRNQIRFRDAQIIVRSTSGQLGLRKVTLAAWLDTPILITPSS